MNNINQKIPEGWSVKKLGEVSLLFSGGTPSKTEHKYWDNGNIKWLSAKYIEENKVIGWDYITEAGLENSSAKLAQINDIILVTRVSVGKIYFCEENYAVNQDLTIIRSKSVNCKFLFFLVKNKQNVITDKSQGLAIKGITKEELSNISLLIPPLAEQEKIAGILGTWDEAIEKLSSLIEQKKNLKKGLMQRLLTGKTRLKGFTQPWKEVKLGEILVERNEYTTQNNQVTILTSSRKGIFRQEDYFDKQVASENNIGYKILHKYDFTYRAMTDDDVYCFNQLTNEDMGAVSPAYSVFYCENVPNLLIKEILNSKCFGHQLLKISQGGTRKSLKFSALKTLKIYIPSDITEQQAIADVLSTADEEIDLLNKKLEALKEQKKGLMQQLLTGQTRVKVN